MIGMDYSVVTILTVVLSLGAVGFNCLTVFYLWRLRRALVEGRRLRADLDEL